MTSSGTPIPKGKLFSLLSPIERYSDVLQLIILNSILDL